MINAQQRYDRLMGVVTEYIDEGEVTEFLSDLKSVIDKEEDYFISRALHYKDLRKKLFSKS
jgi:hypothetical protein